MLPNQPLKFVHFHPFHLKPLCATCHVEKALPPKQHTTEDRCPNPPKLLNPHEEDLQEAGLALSTLSNVPVFHGDPDPLGLVAVVEKVDAGES